DSENRLWIPTWGEGLFRYDPASNSLSHFRQENESHNNLPDNFCYYIFQDYQSNLWLYTSRGLCYLDPALDGFVYFDDPVNIPEHNKQLLPFYAQEDGYIWTTKGEDIYLIHSLTHNLLSISVDTRFKKNLGANALDAFCRDSFGNLWFGREHRGVLRLNPLSQYFNHILPAPNRALSPEKSTIYAILKSRDHPSSLWLLTPNELLLYDHLRQQFSFIEDRTFHNRLASPCNNFVCLFQDDDNSLWIGTSGTGLIHRKTDGRITQYRYSKNDSTTISHDLVWCIHRDHAGRLWIGSNYSGLSRYREESDSFVRYSFGPDLMNAPGMWCILEQRSGVVWMGTEVGLYRYDSDKDSLTCVLDGLSIFTLYEDSKNRIWLGTEYHGLGLYDAQSDAVEFFVNSHDSFYQKIDVILEDQDGYLWCATEGGGLAKFDPQLKTFTTFTEQHGLPSNTLHLGGLKTDDGTFYLSTVFDGMISFHPRDIKPNTIPPKILLTDIKINGSSLPISNDAPLKQDISLTKEIHLHHSDNDITIEMTALHFSYPEKNQYKYWLQNYDENWQSAGANRFAVYTNLNPGRYIFHAQGANGDGIWSADEANLVIVIQPPWWRTSVAYSIYILLIFSLIYGIIKIVKNRERQKAKIRETELQAQTAEARARAAEAHARAVEAEAQVLKAEDERKTKELEQARTLQLSMLSKEIPKLPHLDIAVQMLTAAEVGGDYYDFNHSKDGTLTVAVGDATHHGMRAGNMVVSIKSLFKDLTDDQRIPDFFSKCTKIIKQMNMDKVFMALTIARLHEHQISISSAGMPPIYFYKKAQKKVTEITIKGMPLGAVKDYPYEERTLSFDSGDTLLITSDGLAELFNEQKEMLDYERLSAIFADHAERSPREIIDALVAAAAAWRGKEPQADDMTFAVIKAV
ncbi:SpoIIE family protein phosphatase, partial [candidate division KSB1 bacterium]|nr:SpoIIE family protein phosphatase [candidate division KSB1 bacterium]